MTSESDFGDLQPDLQLCLALYATMNKVSRLYREALRPLDLTFPQYLALVILWAGAPMTVNQVADALASTIGNVSPLLQRLEAGGLVERAKDVADERRVWIKLTPRGLELRQHALRARSAMRRKVCTSDEEIADLRQRLQVLAEQIPS